MPDDNQQGGDEPEQPPPPSDVPASGKIIKRDDQDVINVQERDGDE